MLLNSNTHQLLLRLSSISISLKLKFECKIRLVIQSNAQSYKHPQEPPLNDNNASFSEVMQLIIKNVHQQNLINISVYVVSTRNKYKAGICKLQAKDIIFAAKSSGYVFVQKKLQQCPDKEASITMKIQYEQIESMSNHHQTSSKYTLTNTLNDKQGCQSIVSMNDLGWLTDLQEDSKKSMDKQFFNDKSHKFFKVSLESFDFRQKEIDRNRQKQKQRGKERQSFRSETQRFCKRVSDLSYAPQISSDGGIMDQLDMTVARKQKILKRTSITPKMDSHREKNYELAYKLKLSPEIASEYYDRHSSPRTQQNIILKAELIDIKQELRLLNHKYQSASSLITEHENRAQSLKQSLQLETTRSASLDFDIRQVSHKYQQAKSEIKELKQEIHLIEKRYQLKIVQYKEQLSKTSTKMAAFQGQNQQLMFEVNQLKDEVLKREIDHQNLIKVTQTESTKSCKVITCLKDRISCLQMQIQSLSSGQDVEKVQREELMKEMKAKNKMIQIKTKQIECLNENASFQESKCLGLNQVIFYKQSLITSIIKALENINTKNDEAKVQKAQIAEKQILNILQTISKTIRSQQSKVKQLTNCLEQKSSSHRTLELQCQKLNETLKQQINQTIAISNLYQQTKFRLEVQLNNIEILEQQLFHAKADLESEKQKTRNLKSLQHKVSQLQLQNTELIAHFGRSQRQRQKGGQQTIYRQLPIYSLKKKPSTGSHNHKLSNYSNLSEQEEIKNFINQLQFPAAKQFWQSDQVVESPIRPKKQVSIISEELKDIYTESLF